MRAYTSCPCSLWVVLAADESIARKVIAEAPVANSEHCPQIRMCAAVLHKWKPPRSSSVCLFTHRPPARIFVAVNCPHSFPSAYLAALLDGDLEPSVIPTCPFSLSEATGNSFAYLFITPSWCFQRAKAWPSSVLDVHETGRAYRAGPLFFPSLIWTHPHRHPFTFLYFFFNALFALSVYTP